MGIADRLPLSERPDVRERVDELFSRQMLGAVLVGKFVGDYAAIVMTAPAGVHVGYPLGIAVTVGLFIYWQHVEQRVQEQKDKLDTAQTRIGDDWEK